ncbi:GET complex subunit get1, partial [Coemansia sp. RSA 2399]
MASAFLILTVFILEAVSALVDGVGYGAIATMLWNTYCSVTGNKKASERLELKDSIIQLRRDLRAVSSVDEFARWAKMRRRLDAVSSKFEKTSSDLAIERTAFELYINLVLRAVIYGLRALVSIYNYRRAVFYVPENWFYPVLWFLSLPAAPMGS